jgi:hypothetical protein
MSRSITSGLNTEFGNSDLKPIFLVKIVWDSGTSYVWSGYDDLSWDGQTWTGTGNLGTFGAVSETQEVRAEGMNFTLSGVPSALISQVLSDGRQGNEVSLWIGALDSSNNIVADPYQLFKGLMDVPGIEEGGDTSMITLSAENRLIELERSREVRYTDQFQKGRFSSDKGFEYIASLQNKSINWGKQDIE